MERPLWLLAALALTLVSGVTSRGVPDVKAWLTHVDTLYLPTYDATGQATFSFLSGTMEQLVYHPMSKTVFGVGDGVIHIIDASDVNHLRLQSHVTVPDLELTDVEVCMGGVFISYRHDSDKRHGGLLVYDAHNMSLLQNIPLGSLPDMVYPTADCTVVVAMENEGFVQDGRFYDPEGLVGVLRFQHGFHSPPHVALLDFSSFNGRFEELSRAGVRWVYRGSGNNFSNNIEPEYITFNHNYTKAYVSLQENNAIAVVDLTTDTITDIHGLGYKPWKNLDMDPSDKDGGIDMDQWPVYGMYQPDAIHLVTWGGCDYVITANEGDAQEYGAPASFREEVRGADIADKDISPRVSTNLRKALKDDRKLGRLTLSNVDGRNSAGQFEAFYTYGARSFSIRRASDLQLVYDSGDDIEKAHRNLRPDLFNSHPKAGDSIATSMDTRSDNKGPETESVTAGEVDGHLLIFVGNEKPGTIAVYSAAPGNISRPRFQSLFSGGIPHKDARTWAQMYQNQSLYGLDPEYIQFMPVSSGFAPFPALLVGGTGSGTVSVLRVETELDYDD